MLGGGSRVVGALAVISVLLGGVWSSASAAPDAGVRRTTVDTLVDAWSDLPSQGAPLAGVTYTTIKLFHLRDRTGDPTQRSVVEYVAPGLCSGYDRCHWEDRLEIETGTYTADGSIDNGVVYDCIDSLGPLSVDIAPDLSTANLSGTLATTKVEYRDGVASTTDLGGVQVAVSFSSSDHTQSTQPQPFGTAPTVEVASGSAHGPAAINLDGLWSGAAPDATLTYDDQWTLATAGS